MDAILDVIIYGIPLLMMDLTSKRMTDVADAKSISAPMNQFAHAPRVPDASFHDVVRANVDTLYSSAFLDLSVEPLVLSVPDTHGRYYLLPVMDAWTNVIATPGARTTGTAGCEFLISGPGWKGVPPTGMEEIRSPTRMAWILGRIRTNGAEDYPCVHEIQAGLQLTPLSSLGKPYALPVGVVDPAAGMKRPPVEQLKQMTGTEFLTHLARLLQFNPPAPADKPEMTEKLAAIGIVAGQRFDPGKLDTQAAKVLDGAVLVAVDALQAKARQMGSAVNGWRIPSMNLGAFGTDYDTRAFIALIALGANLPEDALYPTSFVDADNRPLHGANRYILRFSPGETPPVRAFWSVTMYGPDSFFVNNPIDRYAISSWMPLKHQPDGSLDLYIQHDPPGGQQNANWLPAPAGSFNLTMRMYWPNHKPPSILDGSWVPPAVRRSI